MMNTVIYRDKGLFYAPEYEQAIILATGLDIPRPNEVAYIYNGVLFDQESIDRDVDRLEKILTETNYFDRINSKSSNTTIENILKSLPINKKINLPTEVRATIRQTLLTEKSTSINTNFTINAKQTTIYLVSNKIYNDLLSVQAVIPDRPINKNLTNILILNGKGYDPARSHEFVPYLPMKKYVADLTRANKEISKLPIHAVYIHAAQSWVKGETVEEAHHNVFTAASRDKAVYQKILFGKQSRTGFEDNNFENTNEKDIRINALDQLRKELAKLSVTNIHILEEPKLNIRENIEYIIGSSSLHTNMKPLEEFAQKLKPLINSYIKPPELLTAPEIYQTTQIKSNTTTTKQINWESSNKPDVAKTTFKR